MGSIGPLEILLVFLIILLLFGPNKLPKLARALGESLREFKKAAEGKEEKKRKTKKRKKTKKKLAG